MPAAVVKRSYKSRSQADKDTPMVFDIDGVDFTAYPRRIPSAMLMDIAGMAIHGDSEPMWEVFEAAMGDKYQEFRTLLRDPEHAIDAEVLGEIIKDMAEFASERPTGPSRS